MNTIVAKLNSTKYVNSPHVVNPIRVGMRFVSVSIRVHSWFIAYFCVLANGVYIATAWISGDRYLDTSKLLENGTHPATIAIYCILTIGVGYLGFRREFIRIAKSNSSVSVTHPGKDNASSQPNVAESDESRLQDSES